MPVVIPQNFRIVGTGSYLPPNVVTAEELDQRAGWNLGYCREHIGVITRHQCLTPETMISMGREAIQAALDNASLEWSSIDAIIDCSTSQFRPIPCNAVHYQHAFAPNADAIPCFDIQSTCLGSIVALNVINGLFASRAFDRVVLVASESGTGGLNLQQPESAGLMGDGAAAIVLQREETTEQLVFAHETYSDFIDLCKVEGGGHKLPVFEYADERKADYLFSMDGPAVFRVALKHLKPMIQQVLKMASINYTHFNPSALHYVPHQASPKALRAVRCMMGVDQEHFHVAVEEVGNMIAASMPFMLDRVRRQRIVGIGDKIMLLELRLGTRKLP